MEQKILHRSDDIWILHLSDLHIGSTQGEFRQISSRLNKIKDDWLKTVSIEKPDLCVITGDLTKSGSKKEYENLTKCIDFLKSWLGLNSLGHPPLFVVPGNHDQVRSALQWSPSYGELDDNFKELREVAQAGKPSVYLRKEHPHFTRAKDNPVTASNIWADVDDAWTKGVLPRFANYHEWIQEELPHLSSINDMKGGCWHYRTSVELMPPNVIGSNSAIALKKSIPLDIIGLNSAVASTGWPQDQDHHIFWLSSEQVGMVMDKCNPSGIPILALMHHPIFTMSTSDKGPSGSIPDLKKNACLVFSGHVHGTQNFDRQEDSDDALNIIAKAFGDPEEGVTHGYTIVQLGSTQTTIFLRAWNSDQIFETDLLSKSPDGIRRSKCGYSLPIVVSKGIPKLPSITHNNYRATMVSSKSVSCRTSNQIFSKIKLYSSQSKIPRLSILIHLVIQFSREAPSTSTKEAANDLLFVLNTHGSKAPALVQEKIESLSLAIEKQHQDNSHGGII